MSLKKCSLVLWMIPAASLLAYGNSVVSRIQELPVTSNVNSVVIGKRSAASEECVLFHSTLQHVPGGGTGVIKVRRKWNSAHLSETTTEQENTLPLPEPGTGVLLSIGLLATIRLAVAPTKH